jgi:hypothetical protein
VVLGPRGGCMRRRDFIKVIAGSAAATEKGYTRYAKDDQKYKCNEKQSDLEAYYYKSREDFKGKDRFVVEAFYPRGSYRKMIFNIDVR